MKVKVLSESGYNEAVLGFSLSYNTTIERTKTILPKYAFGIPGENKFLESIVLWIDINAPLFLWTEFDTYRVGITKQSESTMHTLAKTELTFDNFEYSFLEFYLAYLNLTRKEVLNGNITIDNLKSVLPSGFLQRRIVSMNYKCLQNIYNQRRNHRLPQWKYFCTEMLHQIEHPEFIIKE